MNNSLQNKQFHYLDNINYEGIALVSAERTTTATSADIENNNCTGVTVILDTTAAGTSSNTLKIQGKDPASGKYFDLLTGAAVTTISTNVYKLFPGLTAVANVTATGILPKTFRIVVTAGNANAATYSVGYCLS